MFDGKLLTLWTVRVALVAYAISLWLRMGYRKSATGLRASRLLWSAGFFAFLMHVALAFQFFHHWSHRAALAATAKQTLETVGLDWGGGLYANYLFAVIWGLDVAWWWTRPASYECRSRFIEWAVQGWLAFIAFNATVVFGAGPIRWLGLLASVVLTARWILIRDQKNPTELR